ncbi:MAG: hypothetical protein V1790_03065 [Planctomycetota bacterium]
MRKRMRCGWGVVLLSVAPGATALAGASGDFDGNGYVGAPDYLYFETCLDLSGPGRTAPFTECRTIFDSDADGDVDLADFAAFQRARGHLPIPLRDTLGNVIAIDSTAPYSGRQTCGASACHDVERISNGMIHQQGRTDAAGNIIMKDDFYGDGRWWVRGSGMYGRWSGGGGGLNRQTAGKDNAHESLMDMTAFYWAANCGGCHVGGGGIEFDRDGLRLWDEGTGRFGYEQIGKTPDQVRLDGDYALIDDSDGSLRPAPWNVTGVAEPECLHCHRSNRTWVNGQDMHREWRGSVLSTTDRLVDSYGQPVPAYASAGTAGQGWFSLLDTTLSPSVLQLDYAVGVADGSLLQQADGALSIPQSTLTVPPTDQACWGCHLPGGFQNKRGTVWFDERDIHFRKFTNRSDDNPANDIADGRATTCNYCHPGDPDHNFAKGDSPYAQFRNELDWVDLRSCRECHLYNSPVRHPDAPDVLGGGDRVAVHLAGDANRGPMAVLSCQACHVPYPLAKGIIVTDRSLTGSDVHYFTDRFLSADPLDPGHSDKTKWYPALRAKVDSDGVTRFFPQKMEVAIYWADWDQKGTPGDRTDDVIYPIILWRVRGITDDQPLPIVTDDNGDGTLEVNRPAEILTYIQALKDNDRYGRLLAANPVLVKGGRIWYEDPLAPEGVSSFDVRDSGAVIQSFEIFGLDHNVLAATQAWGYNAGNPELGCRDCHRNETRDSPVIDRKILIDPFDVNGQAVYQTVRAMTGLNPP